MRAFEGVGRQHRGAGSARPFAGAPTARRAARKLTDPQVSKAPMSKRDKYVTRTRLQLDVLEQQLAALSAPAPGADAGTREVIEQALAAPRADARAAAALLGELQLAGEDAWHRRVSEMERLRHAFEASLAGVHLPA